MHMYNFAALTPLIPPNQPTDTIRNDIHPITSAMNKTATASNRQQQQQYEAYYVPVTLNNDEPESNEKLMNNLIIHVRNGLMLSIYMCVICVLGRYTPNTLSTKLYIPLACTLKYIPTWKCV